MKHILVVDDNVPNLRVAEKALSTDYRVTLLTSGTQALKFLLLNTPDLILLDINMPDLDGYDTLAQIRKIGVQTPVIFLTSISEQKSVEYGINVGKNQGLVDYIIKPYNRANLLARVSEKIR